MISDSEILKKQGFHGYSESVYDGRHCHRNFNELGLECSATQFWSVGLEARDHDLIFSWLEVKFGRGRGKGKKGDRK